MAGANVVEFTTTNWESEVENSDVPVVVDFWAPWCGPCRQLAPIIDRIADQYEGKVKVGKLNIDDAQDLAVKYGIMNIPRVYVFKGSEPVEKIVGFQSENELVKTINSVLES